MTELFEMLSVISRRRNTKPVSPFATLKSTEKWLRKLPVDSDYDMHHALIEGLEHFNAENEAATLGRYKALRKLETVGLPLQLRIVEQYVRNQSTFRLARQALWRESWAFWSMMAEAWLTMLKQAYRGPASTELKPYAAEMATRALRYAGLAMRWDYHQVRSPVSTAWCRVHKIYRLAERDGIALHEVEFNGGKTHCAREYMLIVLMGMVQPLGYRALEIESVAQIFEDYQPLPLPVVEAQPGVHTHMVDLSASEGAYVLDNVWTHGSRLRYLELRPLVAYLKSLARVVRPDVHPGFATQVASLIERGGIRRNRQRTHRFGRVWVAVGMEPILQALVGAGAGAATARPALEPWMLRDESTEGMGFTLPEASELPHGHLVAVCWEPAENSWQLLATRWNREEDGQHLMGAQRLSRHPKRVEIFADPEALETAPDALLEKTTAVYLPMTHNDQTVSNLLIPRSHYRLGSTLMLRDGEVLYRLRLGAVQEGHAGWLRVAMDVLTREQLAAAA